jgi:hypothetical protein
MDNILYREIQSPPENGDFRIKILPLMNGDELVKNHSFQPLNFVPMDTDCVNHQADISIRPSDII